MILYNIKSFCMRIINVKSRGFVGIRLKYEVTSLWINYISIDIEDRTGFIFLVELCSSVLLSVQEEKMKNV
jgi:hypothetical protein